MKRKLQELPSYGRASQELMNMLYDHGFRQVGYPVEEGRWLASKYRSGEIHYFMKNGECRITFLKDGRIHVLNGPDNRWQLHEYVSERQWQELIYFCSLSMESQNLRRDVKKAGHGI